MDRQPSVRGRHSGQFLLRDALISLVALLLAFAAFDDITTDNSTRFTTEYIVLLGCALWFGFLAVRLIRVGRRTLGFLSLLALSGALWGQRGIGTDITPALWPEYVVTIGVFLWFLALTATLMVLGRRGVAHSAISPQ
jgi:hypothetical protein